jgi:hypothetical protein
VINMNGNQDAGLTDEPLDPEAEAFRQELARHVVEPADLPGGYQLEGPAEPGAAADIPGVLGGPGITITPDDEDDPGTRI